MSEWDMNVDYSGRNAILDVLEFEDLGILKYSNEYLTSFVYERRHDSLICG